MVPWASDINDAEPIWPYMKPLLVRSSGTLCTVRYTSQLPTPATIPAISGASMAGTSTLDATPLQMTPCPPTAASIAPMMPPIRACDELDGMPSSQVNRFHTIPPTRPANTNSRVTSPDWTRPLAMVAATAVERNAPTKLSEAHSATAVFGLSAPLAIEGAMALPVSWNPFVKSNANAVTTTMIKSTN